jgi:hypothetical protein
MKLGFVEEETHDDLWYFCLHLSEQFISVEISRPTSVISGIVTAFSDRIIVAKPGEIPGIRRVIVTEDFVDLPKPQVTRKTG